MGLNSTTPSTLNQMRCWPFKDRENAKEKMAINATTPIFEQLLGLFGLFDTLKCLDRPSDLEMIKKIKLFE